MSTTLAIEPLTATIGAEIGGVDLADDLSDDTIAEIREALLEWKVIFFRDQHRLDRDAHIAFGRRFGELEVHPLTPDDQEQPEVFVHPGGREAPRARRLAQRRDLAARAVAGFDPAQRRAPADRRRHPLGRHGRGLRPARRRPTKDRIDDLVAFHDYTRAFGCGQPPEVQEQHAGRAPDGRAPGRADASRDRAARRSTSTPRSPAASRGWTTPRRGRCCGGSSTRPSSPTCSAASAGGPGSVAFWDNRATQHCVSNDFLPARRVMERVTVVGDRPF